MFPDHAGLKYRADIDGLRAIAVVAVVFYHANVPGFEGGYVGVDVFFVISGFLITRVLDVPSGDSRSQVLMQFYLRRARRILPALFVMLAVCAAIATMLYLPADLREFGRSLTLAAAFLGNFGAWLTGGYFAPGERFTPLRHLWSIGVEEQFYLVYPLCLFIITGWRSIPRSALLTAMGLMSLVLSFLAADHWPIPNYFMLPTRAWELLVGAIVAVSPGLFLASPRVKQALAALGMAGLLTVIWYARVIRFPGTATIGASVCAALLIVGNSSGASVVGRVLSLRPVVLTGLISYSLYLWHAPILAFCTYYSIHDLSALERVLILSVVYLIALGSWAAVEQPFRSKKIARSASIFVPAALGTGVALAALGYWLMRTDRLPTKPESLLPSPTDSAPYYPSIAPSCFNISLTKIAEGGLCSFGPQNDTAKKVVVWGDSHAFALLMEYQSLAETDGIRIYFGVQGACWPLLGSEAVSSGEFWHARCMKFNAAMVKAIHALNPQRVILNAYWLDPGAATEQEFRRRAPQARSDVIDGIKRTLDAVQSADRSVCAVLTVPGYPYPIPYALAMAGQRRLNFDSLSITRTEALREYQNAESGLRLLAGQNRLRVADPKDVLCPNSGCLIRQSDGTPLYRDANHMSLAGSHFLSGILEECLEDLH